MARSSGGRPVRSSHPSWPPLRVRAVLNGLVAAAAGIGLLWLTWGALDFTVFDASGVPAPVRVIALWFAVGLPIAWLAIGLHLLVAAMFSSDRVLLAHGSAEWEPGAQDDVLRGVRVRRWRLGLLGGRRVSAPTLGWLPELSPYGLAPLGGGILTLLVMLAWMARGYGAGVIALIAAILWLGWRLLRGWQAWSDVRDHRARPRPSQEPDSTPDEVWEDEERDDDWQDEPEPARSRAEDLDSIAGMPRYREDRPTAASIAATRRVDRAEEDDPTAALPLYVDDDEHRGASEDGPQTAPLQTVPARDEPLRRGRRGRRGARGDSEHGSADDGPPEVLVDRSVQRAIRAKQARRGAPVEQQEPARGRSGRGRGSGRGSQRPGPAAADEQPQGLRAYLGQRRHQGQEDSGTRALRESAGQRIRREDRVPAPRPRPTSRPTRSDEPFDQDRPSRRGGAPTAADAMDEIYGHDDHAPSLLSYLSRRRDDDAG